MWKTLKQRRRRLERGQAYVEFVLVLPAILMLTLLAWELAYVQWGRIVVSTATFESARQIAAGRSPAVARATYNELMSTGLGHLADTSHFSLSAQPGQRSVRAQTDVPWQWPIGLAGLMGGGMNLHLKASAFFRLEQFYPGPPSGPFE